MRKLPVWMLYIVPRGPPNAEDASSSVMPLTNNTIVASRRSGLRILAAVGGAPLRR
jgi:hypothetical protein